MNKVFKPSNILFERIAGEMAAVFYEVGRSQGMTSKYKNARLYAKHNLEKFLPKAIELCIDMLGRSDISDDMKEMIYDELQERVNDPTNATSDSIKGLADVDITKVLTALNLKTAPTSQALKPVREKPISIRTQLNSRTAIGKVNG